MILEFFMSCIPVILLVQFDLKKDIEDGTEEEKGYSKKECVPGFRFNILLIDYRSFEK